MPLTPPSPRGEGAVPRIPLTLPSPRGEGGLSEEAHHVSGLAAVAGVEDAAEFGVGVEESVGFIDDERGLSFVDHSEESGGADIGGGHGVMYEFGKDVQQGGFPTTLFGRLN